MTAVTVNNRTYSDDSNPVTGLGNGGHRTRLIPLFADSLVEIANQVQVAGQSYRAASTSAVVIGAGAKTFVVPPNKAFAIGDAVLARQTTDPAIFMAGTVTDFAPATGVLTIAVSTADFSGFGTVADWTISGPAGPRGLPGLSGFAYVWDAAVAQGDPGPGLMRANNAALASATALYVDPVDAFGVNLAGAISGWSSSSSAVKGQILLRSQADPSQQILFDLTAAVSAAGYFALAVVYRSGAANLVAGDAVTLDFRRTGDKGDAGAIGPVGAIAVANDGTAIAPGIAFSQEPGLGLRRQSAGVIRVSASGSDLLSLAPATTAEALAGTDALKVMTAARVAEAIAARSLGVGAIMATGDLTLTAASGGAIAVTPSAPGFFATLPAANAMPTAGVGVFSISNAGSFDYGVRDSTGAKLGWIPPRGACVINLVDKTTAAGVWNCVGAEKIGVTAEFSTVAQIGIASPTDLPPQTIDIGAGRTLFLIASNNGAYGLVHDGANRTWGAITLIRANVSHAIGLSPSAGTALVVTCNAASPSVMNAVVVSISGTAITVNGAASLTLGGAVTTYNRHPRTLTAVGSGYVFGYGRTPNHTCVVAMTIAGATVTLGSETVIDATVSYEPMLYASGSILRTFIGKLDGSVTATPYNLSGVTLTLGGAAVATGQSGNIGGSVGDLRGVNALRTIQNSNGNIVAQYLYFEVFGGMRAAVFKLTGTTELVSQINLMPTLGASGTMPSSLMTGTDLVDLGGGKALAIAANASSSGVWVNILSDVAGVASVGTEMVISASGADGCEVLFASPSSVRALIRNGSSDVTVTQVALDISGTTLTRSAAQTLSGVAFSAAPSNRAAQRSPLLLRTGTTAYCLPPNSTSSIGLDVVTATTAGLRGVLKPRTGPRRAWGVGANDAETWLGSLLLDREGLVLNKLEVAA